MLENECKCCPRNMFCTMGWVQRGEEEESQYKFFLDLSKKGSTAKCLNSCSIKQNRKRNVGSKFFIPSGARHPMFIQHPMEPRWIFPPCAIQSILCPQRERLSLFFWPLSSFIISSQESNSLPKECYHWNLLLHFEVQARPCGWCNHQY